MPCPLVGRGNTKMLQNDFNFALLRFLPPYPLKLHPLQLSVRSWWVSGSDSQRLSYLLRYICMGSCYWWLTSLQTGTISITGVIGILFAPRLVEWQLQQTIQRKLPVDCHISVFFDHFQISISLFFYGRNTKFSTGFKFTSMWYCTIIHCHRAGTCTGGSGVKC